MTGTQMHPNLITGILNVPDRRGYTRAVHEHTTRAITLTSGPARICPGSLSRPFGPSIGQPPSLAEPAPPGPA